MVVEVLDSDQCDHMILEHYLVAVMFQTGEQMGDVDLNIHFKMEDLANVTQRLMLMRRDLVVPQKAGAGTVTNTANVLNAPTLGNLLQEMVSMFPKHNLMG